MNSCRMCKFSEKSKLHGSLECHNPTHVMMDENGKEIFRGVCSNWSCKYFEENKTCSSCKYLARTNLLDVFVCKNPCMTTYRNDSVIEKFVCTDWHCSNWVAK